MSITVNGKPLFKKKKVTDLRKIILEKERIRAKGKAEIAALKEQVEEVRKPKKKHPSFVKAIGVGATTVAKGLAKKAADYEKQAPARRAAELKRLKEEAKLLKARKEVEKYTSHDSGFGLGGDMFGEPQRTKGKKQKRRDPFEGLI